MTFSDKKNEKNEKKYFCEKCLFTTCKKTDFMRHLLTAKHKIVTNSDKKNEKNENHEINKFVCSCGKEYRYRQGLSYHKKKCNGNTDTVDCKDFQSDNIVNPVVEDNYKLCELQADNDELRTMIKQLITENAKQQQQIGDLIPLIGNKTINNTQNNKISIKMFLDEHCKNAINMTDFVNSIKVTLDQLEYTTQHGLTDGLTKTIMDNINRLSIYERPLHCTDVKRETLYIKDDDKWSKDNSRERMKLAIKGATNANYRALKDWQGVHPDFRKDERLTEYFTDMILKLGRSLDGIDDKVLRNLCRSTYLKIGEFNIE